MSQINPNTSRFDKIKKLFHISSELISEYGLSYFLRIAFRELLLQKTALFSPDNTSIEIKNEVVTEDPKEAGLRKILNFGHTGLYISYSISL